MEFKTEAERQKYDMQQLIGNTLRIGVSLACLVAFVGGHHLLSEAWNGRVRHFTISQL